LNIETGLQVRGNNSQEHVCLDMQNAEKPKVEPSIYLRILTCVWES